MNEQNSIKKTVASPFPVYIFSNHWLYNRFTQWFLHFYYSLKGPSKPSLNGTFMEFGKFVWIHDKVAISKLYQSGAFGKGSLSRSNPTWFTRTVEEDKNALEEITVARRKKRRQQKNKTQTDIQEHHEDILTTKQILNLAENSNIEVFQLDLYEAFFLKYGLNALSIVDSKQNIISIKDCWSLFCKQNKNFDINYAVYHYYRSLGWVPKNGIKFGVDFVLYQSGPSYRHADYAVKIIPIYQDKIEEPKSWSWFLRLNRVCTQVKKTLILCYVHVPLDTSTFSNLNEYSIREVIYKRWSPQKNRE